jgi:hypothetical protein
MARMTMMLQPSHLPRELPRTMSLVRRAAMAQLNDQNFFNTEDEEDLQKKRKALIDAIDEVLCLVNSSGESLEKAKLPRSQ